MLARGSQRREEKRDVIPERERRERVHHPSVVPLRTLVGRDLLRDAGLVQTIIPPLQAHSRLLDLEALPLGRREAIETPVRDWRAVCAVQSSP